jgi:hypothetical protein
MSHVRSSPFTTGNLRVARRIRGCSEFLFLLRNVYKNESDFRARTAAKSGSMGGQSVFPADRVSNQSPGLRSQASGLDPDRRLHTLFLRGNDHHIPAFVTRDLHLDSAETTVNVTHATTREGTYTTGQANTHPLSPDGCSFNRPHRLRFTAI